MQRLHRGALAAASTLVAAGITAVSIWLFYLGPTQDYRDCVALLWDHKHPMQVRERHLKQAARQCEKNRLSDLRADAAGSKCDADEIVSFCEKSFANDDPVVIYRVGAWKTCIESGSTLFPPAEEPYHVPENPCEHLSLEELRRADVEAIGDKP